jgi:hypothetical protein
MAAFHVLQLLQNFLRSMTLPIKILIGTFAWTIFLFRMNLNKAVLRINTSIELFIEWSK